MTQCLQFIKRGSWLRRLFGSGTAWANTEYRTYTFRDEIHSDGPLARRLHTDNDSLIETPESRQRRGKAGPMPDRGEQKILAKLCKEGWNARYQVVKRLMESEPRVSDDVK